MFNLPDRRIDMRRVFILEHQQVQGTPRSLTPVPRTDSLRYTGSLELLRPGVLLLKHKRETSMYNSKDRPILVPLNSMSGSLGYTSTLELLCSN